MRTEDSKPRESSVFLRNLPIQRGASALPRLPVHLRRQFMNHAGPRHKSSSGPSHPKAVLLCQLAHTIDSTARLEVLYHLLHLLQHGTSLKSPTPAQPLLAHLVCKPQCDFSCRGDHLYQVSGLQIVVGGAPDGLVQKLHLLEKFWKRRDLGNKQVHAVLQGITHIQPIDPAGIRRELFGVGEGTDPFLISVAKLWQAHLCHETQAKTCFLLRFVVGVPCARGLQNVLQHRVAEPCNRHATQHFWGPLSQNIHNPVSDAHTTTTNRPSITIWLLLP
mmetsp:Transcript_30217/g.83379  ORF Transcript_30217/g.83379 Transcript_30217/m.83379 type:complete len:276 (+) Transcript_30217:58-885(+)